MTIIGIFAFAVLAFLTCIATIMAMLTWNKPMRLGTVVLEPAEARSFVLRGMVGAAILPLFIASLDAMFALNLNWDYLLHFIGAGYVLGSLGLEFFFIGDESVNTAQTYIPPQPKILVPPKSRPLRPEPQPFRFASWDDEEEQR